MAGKPSPAAAPAPSTAVVLRKSLREYACMSFSFPVTGCCGRTASVPVVPDDAVHGTRRTREQELCRVIAVSPLPQFHQLAQARAAADCSNRGQSAGAAEQSR